MFSATLYFTQYFTQWLQCFQPLITLFNTSPNVSSHSLLYPMTSMFSANHNFTQCLPYFSHSQLDPMNQYFQPLITLPKWLQCFQPCITLPNDFNVSMHFNPMNSMFTATHYCIQYFIQQHQCFQPLITLPNNFNVFSHSLLYPIFYPTTSIFSATHTFTQ